MKTPQNLALSARGLERYRAVHFLETPHTYPFQCTLAYTRVPLPMLESDTDRFYTSRDFIIS